MKLYDERNCKGDAQNITKLTNGCKWEKEFDLNRTFPFYNGTINIFNSSNNNTYFEVTVCGDGTNWWWYMMIGIASAVLCLCVCCCGCIARYVCCKQDNKNKQRNIDPLIVNASTNNTKEGGYTMEEGEITMK